MRYRRSDTPGATYFFTVAIFRRRPLFAVPDNAALLRSALRYVMARHPFTIGAFVLLPDHLHCLWTLPPGDADFATRWMLVKSQVGCVPRTTWCARRTLLDCLTA